MNKNCKQCTKSLPDTDEFFRPYVPRGTGLRKTVVGRNTVCRECEQLNNLATRVFKNGPKTDQERTLLEKLPAYYMRLVAMGGQPIGAYAKHVLSVEAAVQPRASSTLDSILDKITDTLGLDVGQDDSLLDEYDGLLHLGLWEEPDKYQGLLETLREKTPVGTDGRVAEQYRHLYVAVATRFDDYEDNYTWE